MHYCFRLFLTLFLFVALNAQAATSAMPYAKAGLTEAQAAGVLLDRFTFGARPGEVDNVVGQGLDKWFDEQLAAAQPEPDLTARLAAFPAVGMNHRQLMSTFPGGSQVTAQARRAYDLVPPADVQVDFEWTSRKLAKFRQENGYLSQDGELYPQLTGQKIIRAAYAQNQLAEVLTAFWLNHFYVSSTNFRSKPWVLAYESEAIRPHALGHFRELLESVAKHPAKVQATAGDADKSTLADPDTTMGRAIARLEAEGKAATVASIKQQLARIDTEEDLLLQRRFWSPSGANREYARLLLQQTVGKDAYTEADQQALARIFTGWSTLPYGVNDEWFTGGFQAAASLGFVQEGSFVFRADRHDALEKKVFGRTFTAGGGLKEGEVVLDILAEHPATANWIAGALAEQFIGPEPDSRLVKSLAATFRSSDGDIRAVVRSLVRSEQFWTAAAVRTKVKSPFEYAISAARASEADISDTVSLTQWIGFMGEPLYAYADANGLPRDKDWVGSGSFTTRVKFALSLSGGEIAGVTLPPTVNSERLALQIASPQFQVR